MKSILAVISMLLLLAQCNFALEQSRTKPDVSASPGPDRPTDTKVNGLTVSWIEQGMSFTLPAGWRRSDTEIEDTFKLEGPDGAGLQVSVVSAEKTVSPESELRGEYESLIDLQKQGKYAEVRYLEVDGIRGVTARHVGSAAAGDEPRLMTWVAYRKYRGKLQFISLILGVPGRAFNERRDELFNILQAVRLEQS